MQIINRQRELRKKFRDIINTSEKTKQPKRGSIDGHFDSWAEERKYTTEKKTRHKRKIGLDVNHTVS